MDLEALNIYPNALLCHWCNTPIEEVDSDEAWLHKDSGKVHCGTAASPRGRALFPVHYPDTCSECQTMWAPFDLVREGETSLRVHYKCTQGHEWATRYSTEVKTMPF